MGAYHKGEFFAPKILTIISFCTKGVMFRGKDSHCVYLKDAGLNTFICVFNYKHLWEFAPLLN